MRQIDRTSDGLPVTTVKAISTVGLIVADALNLNTYDPSHKALFTKRDKAQTKGERVMPLSLRRLAVTVRSPTGAVIQLIMTRSQSAKLMQIRNRRSRQPGHAGPY